MSGHSHWATIKHKKGAADAKKGKEFSKLAKAIITAAKHGGGDPTMNLKLQYAIDKARAANMPKDNIQRAIKRGTGEIGGASLEELVYEAYGPGGVAIMIEIMTDNRNRTASEVRKILDHRGGRLGESGCVEWMFDRKALFGIPRTAMDEEQLMDIAIEAGAENVEPEGDLYMVTCAPGDFDKVRQALEAKGLKPELAELSRIPKTEIEIKDKDEARRILGLMEEIEEHDDVQNVFANFDIPEEIAREIEEE